MNNDRIVGIDLGTSHTAFSILFTHSTTPESY
jgi:hypothetical protein